MLEQFIGNRDTVQRLRSSAIGVHLDSFVGHLAQCGYVSTTVRSQLALLGHFSEWMTRDRCGIPPLNDELTRRFLKDRKRHGRLGRGDAATLDRFLTHLRTAGVVPLRVPIVDESPLAEWQRHYEQYLRAERGLAPATVPDYVGTFRWFLTDRFGEGPLDLRALDVSTITTFVIRHARTMSPGYAKNMVTALRSICRFLWQRGAIDTDLAAGLPRVVSHAIPPALSHALSC